METKEELIKMVGKIIENAAFPEIETDINNIPERRFLRDMVLKKIYPHDDYLGTSHEGDMKIYWANNAGDQASAICSSCGVVVRLRRVDEIETRTQLLKNNIQISWGEMFDKENITLKTKYPHENHKGSFKISKVGSYRYNVGEDMEYVKGQAKCIMPGCRKIIKLVAIKQ